jgi:hypothetical protein
LRLSGVPVWSALLDVPSAVREDGGVGGGQIIVEPPGDLEPAYVKENASLPSRKLVLIVLCAGLAFPGTATAAPPLEAVDGGLSWYGRFSHAFRTDDSYFPIGVWFESVVSQEDIDKDKDVGLNTYVVLTGNSSLPLVASNGMRYLAHHADWTGRAGEPGAGAIAGWELRDEIDMELGADPGYLELQRILASLPGDGRLRYNNYGKGVLFWETDAEAARFVNAADLVSADAYWFTDRNVCGQYEGGALLNGSTRDLTPAECHRAANYGATVKRVRELVSPRGSKPVWAFVEVGHPFTQDDWPTIAPAEVQAAVWHSLIAGARGVIYFNHSFGGPNQTQHALRDPAYAAIRSAVKETNTRIATLAPVLNAPTVSSGWSQGAGTSAIVKWANGNFYVFAGSAGSAVTGRFSLPCVSDARATVLYEGRTIAVAGGSFEDSFADGNAIHIYRIDGGSTCGLPPGAAGGGGSQRGTDLPLRTRVGRLPRRVSLRSRRLVVPITCKAPCLARSRLTIRKGSRRILLAANQRRFAAGRHKLILRLSRRDRRQAADRVMRLRTVIVEGGDRVTRTQRLMARRR